MDMKSKRYTPPNSKAPVPAPGSFVAVLLTLPDDHPVAVKLGPNQTGRVVKARYATKGRETRLWDIQLDDGTPIVDLPLDVRVQLPANVPIIGRLIIDDGARLLRATVRSEGSN